MARTLNDPTAVTSFGLKLFLEYAKWHVDPTIVHEVFKAILTIHYSKDKEMLDEPSDEEAENYEDQLAEVRQHNENSYLDNQALERLKTRVKVVKTEMPEYNELEEQCVLTVNNYLSPEEEARMEAHERITPVKKQSSITAGDAAKKQSLKENSKNTTFDAGASHMASEEGSHEIERFTFEKLPSKVEILSPNIPVSRIIHHPEGSFLVKKTLLDKAKFFWKE